MIAEAPQTTGDGTLLMLIASVDERFLQPRSTCRLFPAGVGEDLPYVVESGGLVASPGP
jgi:hypothetical protein